MEIKVKLKDGSSRTFYDVPDDITPEQAKERAIKEFGGNVTELERVQSTVQTAPAEPKKNSFLQEAGAVADKSIRGGLLALPQAAQDISNMVPRTPGTRGLVSLGLEGMLGKREPAQLSEGQRDAAKLIAMQNPADIIKKYTGGDIRQPQSRTGKFIGEAGQGMVAGLAGPGGLTQPIRNMAIGGSAGLGSETAATMVGADGKGETLARLGGGLAGGGLMAAGTSLIPNAQKLTKQATSFMKPEDWKMARELEATLEGSGISHLKSQLLGPSSTMDDLIQKASAHPDVRPLLINAVKNSPKEAQHALNVWMHKTLPPVIDDSRRKLMQDIQDIAAAGEKARYAASNSAYTAALRDGVSSETYGKDFIKSMRTELRLLANNEDYYGPNSDGGKAIQKFLKEKLVKPKGDTPKGYINNLLKDLNKLNEQEGYKGLPTENIKRILKDYTADDFGAARAAKEDVIKNSLQPYQKGLAGQISRMGGGIKPDKHTATKAAIDITFPFDSAQATEVKQLGVDLGHEVVGTLLRESLSRRMKSVFVSQKNEATAVTAPFNYTKQILNSDNTIDPNIAAGIEVIAKGYGKNPGAVNNGFFKLMRAFKSFKDLKLASSVDGSAIAEQVGENLSGTLLTPNVSFRRLLSEKMTKKTYTKLADIVTSKSGLDILEKISKSPDPKAAQVLARSILATAVEDNEDDE